MLKLIKGMLNQRDEGNLSQYLAVFTSCLVILTTGFHYGWTTPSLKKIMSEEYPFDVSEDEGSTIAVVAYVGDVIGAFAGCALADLMGRKWTILAISVPQTLGFLLIYLSYYAKELLYVARISGGIAQGAVLAICPVYVAEITSPEVRGRLGISSTTCFFAGSLFINLIGSYVDIHTTALICLIFPVLLWLLFTSMPESPYFLLMKNKKEEACESLKTLRRKESIGKELASLGDDVARQMSERGKFIDLFINPVNRRAFIIVVIARMSQQLSGIAAYTHYFQILIQQSTNISPILGSSLIILIQLLMMIFITFFIDRFGRKVLLIVSSLTTALVLYILGAFMAIKDFTSVDVSHLNWFPLFMMIMYIITYCIGFAAIINIITAEMFSSSIKAKGISVISIFYSLSAVGSTKYYQFTADNVSLALPFSTFATCSLLAGIFFYFMFIETKGKTLETIQQELRGKRKETTVGDLP